MKILSIGNSFSEDAQRYLHRIAESDGVELYTVNLCIGGCPLELHANNIKSGDKAYLTLKKTGEQLALNLSLSDRQREILLAGGTLNYTKLKG